MALKAHTHNNEIEVLHSKSCSCLFCRQSFDARDVHDWTSDDNGLSAICPECGMDAVVPDNGGAPLDKATLKEANLAFYGEDYMKKNPEAALTYVKRYEEGKITHKKENEALYIEYLSLLSAQGNPGATFTLGQLYEFGGEFTEKDEQTAFSYYASPSLRDDGEALARLGTLCASGINGKKDPRGAYEAYAKGMGLGSMKASLSFAECYLNGVGVNVDQSFAFDMLSRLWAQSYTRFYYSTGRDFNIFPELCYKFGLLYEKGFDGPSDSFTAARFYMLSLFAYGIEEGTIELLPYEKEYFDDAKKRLDALSTRLNLISADPIFDNDTFADSLLTNDPEAFSLGKTSIVSSSYDEANKTLNLELKYSFPPLIIDIESLFCGFVPNNIVWQFSGVSSFSAGEKKEFERISGCPEIGWNFLLDDENEQTLAFSIAFEESKEDKSAKDENDEEKGNTKA